MIEIKTLQKYYTEDKIFITEHTAESFRQRGIKAIDIRTAVNNGEIIEQYPEDFPFPSCLIYGRNKNNKILHICMSDEGTCSRIITAYYPDPEKWNTNLKIRKEKQK